jgi:hypothetical protein
MDWIEKHSLVKNLYFYVRKTGWNNSELLALLGCPRSLRNQNSVEWQNSNVLLFSGQQISLD